LNQEELKTIQNINFIKKQKKKTKIKEQNNNNQSKNEVKIAKDEKTN